MCGMFGVQSEAYDAEPNRNVVATAKKEEVRDDWSRFLINYLLFFLLFPIDMATKYEFNGSYWS
jgi:hypothetical protein